MAPLFFEMPALQYHPEAYGTAGPKLMGRHAAGESFLRGLLSHGTSGAIHLQISDSRHVEAFPRQGHIKTLHPITRDSLSRLAEAGTLFLPGPALGTAARERAAFGHGAWSVCGVTHTTASANAMDAVAALLTAPVQPWDALICTSEAVKANVMAVLQAELDALSQRLGCSRYTLPLLPVIPLGIHTADFLTTSDEKAAARRKLGVGPKQPVVLFMGRLSFHAKAHPLQMYDAMQAAAMRTGVRPHLIECGWHANGHIRDAFAAAAQMAAPDLTITTLDGRDASQRRMAWAAADIFCSFSDNIQETFGITPLEAMAAGLPVVVSDWDGYKETVRHGFDGFRVPTLMPAGGLGGDLALRHALELDSYDMYCGHACSLVAVDGRAATEAFAALFNDPDLRRRMGDVGRARAREAFDWAVIIPRYEALWAELNGLRADQGPRLATPTHTWPARMDPFHAFAAYPSAVLTAQSELTLVDRDLVLARQRLAQRQGLAMVQFAKWVMPSAEELEHVLSVAASGPKPAAALVQELPTERQAFVFRALVWLIKIGVLKINL